MNWLKNNMKSLSKLFIIIFALYTTANAQVTIHQSIDIAGGIKDSTIQWNVYPGLNWNSIDKIFDGNAFTEAGVNNSDTLSLTLKFSEPVNFSKAKVIFFNDGVWSLESANSLSDLNSKTRSYHSYVSEMKDTAFTWDSLEFSSSAAQYIRLSAKNFSDTSVYIGEFSLEKDLKLKNLVLIPFPPKLIPGTTLRTHLKIVDENGNLSDYNLNYPVVYRSSDESIATIDATGYITGVAPGNCTITVSTESGTLSGKAPVQVLQDFTSQRVLPRVVKVALIIQDPIIPQFGNIRVHQEWGWTDPKTMVAQIQQEFLKASDSTVIFKIAEMHDDQNVFTMIDSTYMTIDTVAYYFQSNHLYNNGTTTSLQYIAEQQNRIRYDYNGMIKFYGLDKKRNNGDIDEVWVYAFPFGGMYESELAGPGAFFWNSPPLPSPTLKKTLSIMGWNYERGVAEAMHSMGHRFESALRHAYGRWDDKNSDPNMWELFTRIDKDVPGGANIGNIHYPPNGQSDYDYGDSKAVTTYADNWKRYPYILNQHRTVTCSEWGCSQIGYMRWWFSHLPRYTGTYNGKLNNWWAYALDYYAAVDSANAAPVITDVQDKIVQSPVKYELGQNYPNPFNPTTTIKFRIASPGHVTLRVYDILGRLVASLVNQNKTAGNYSVVWNGRNEFDQAVSSGIYFYRMKANDFIQTKKMILLK